MADIEVSKLSEVYVRFDCEPGIASEISDHFTFTVPGYKFMPSYRSGMWDGKIRLANAWKRTLYTGLLKDLAIFAKERGYSFKVSPNLMPVKFTEEDAWAFIKTLNIPEHLTPRPHQVSAFVESVRMGRSLMLSPTSSGKSMIIYLLYRYYQEMTDLPIVVVVPSIGLVAQMAGDFEEYGYDPDLIHQIMAGKDKNSKKPCWVTTWHSIVNQKKDYFNQFGMIMIDEAHLAKSKSLTRILESADEVPYRFGCTGTLDGSETHELVSKGLFGPVINVITTKEMQDLGYAAKTLINVVVLKWPTDITQALNGGKLKLDYQDEVKWVRTNKKRNHFITKLATSLNGNVLILFNNADQGSELRAMAEEFAKDKDIIINFIDGKVKGADRDEIRKSITHETRTITIASLGTTSTGISVKDFHYLIFAHPNKGRIRNLQSIGRLLRVSQYKDYAEIYDIADDISWKSYKNFGLRHMFERIKQYTSEKHRYKVRTINM